MTASSIPVLRVGDTLLVSLQTELKDTLADQFQEDLLTALAASGSGGLVVDISAVDIVDSYVARILAETTRMAALMGATAILVGMRPAVAATLVRMGFPMEDVETALNIDDALVLIQRIAAVQRRSAR